MSKAEKAMMSGAVSSPGGCAGLSIVEMMEVQLDEVIERLMTDSATEDGRDPGRAEGIALCIAIIRQPYTPNLESVKNDAMLRWESRIADGASEEDED